METLNEYSGHMMLAIIFLGCVFIMVNSVYRIHNNKKYKRSDSTDPAIVGYTVLCDDFLISKGFSEATRWFDNRWKQFRVYYKKEGYDCDILLSPAPQVVGDMTPEQQVDEFSDVGLLENHHYSDWHVYVNSIDNHLTTLNECSELIELMRVCRCPLIGT